MSSYCLVFLLFILFLKSGVLFAQCDTNKISRHFLEFQFFATLGLVDEQNEKIETKYNINRTLLIYKFDIAKQLRFSIAGDTYLKDKSQSLNLTPYLKRAYLQYHDKKYQLQQV